MGMKVREGQRNPYRPEDWDKYDVHPGHPEPEVKKVTENDTIDSCGALAISENVVCEVVGYGSSQYRYLSVAHGEGPQVFKSV